MLKNHAIFGFNPLALIIIAEQILQMYCNELINWDDFKQNMKQLTMYRHFL